MQRERGGVYAPAPNPLRRLVEVCSLKEWSRFCPLKTQTRASRDGLGMIKQFMHEEGLSLAAEACPSPRHNTHFICPSSMGICTPQSSHVCACLDIAVCCTLCVFISEESDLDCNSQSTHKPTGTDSGFPRTGFHRPPSPVTRKPRTRSDTSGGPDRQRP